MEFKQTTFTFLLEIIKNNHHCGQCCESFSKSFSIVNGVLATLRKHKITLLGLFFTIKRHFQLPAYATNNLFWLLTLPSTFYLFCPSYHCDHLTSTAAHSAFRYTCYTLKSMFYISLTWLSVYLVIFVYIRATAEVEGKVFAM